MIRKREDGSGSFRKKGSSIEFRVWYNGQQKSFTGKTEVECKRKFREWVKAKAQEEVLQNKTEYSSMTLIEYINYWLTTYKYGQIKDSTYDRLENVIRHQIAPYDISKCHLNELTEELLQKHINDQSLFYSRSTVKKIYDVFNASLHKAYNNKLIERDIMYDVKVPAESSFINHPTNKIEIYSDEEIRALTKASYELYLVDSRKYRYAPVFLLMINTGIRFGEMLALKWDHVDLKTKTILIEYSAAYVQNRGRFDSENKKVSVITSTKTKNGNRIIPLNKNAYESLIELKNRQKEYQLESEYVLCNLQGGRMQGRSVQDVFASICDDIGVCPKGLHALRHTFATKMIQNNVDIGIISRLLGHSSVKITYDTYIHFVNKQKANAIEAVDF